MSDFSVKVVRINDVSSHPNADRLDICHIAGWQCIAQKGTYKPGDLAIYIPIDSILPANVESTLFGPDAKVKLSKSRVKTIKLRGAISQGMLAKCSLFNVPEVEGHDCTKELGIVKFEPPEAPPTMRGNSVSKKKKNPLFREYGGLDNFKHNPTLFKEGELVAITEKIHGTNTRFGWLPVTPHSMLDKVKQKLGMFPEYEFVFGSNRVQLQGKHSANPVVKFLAKSIGRLPIRALRKKLQTGFYEQNGIGNVYEEIVKKYNLKERTKDYRGYIFYGEIYGDGIQKNYTYGCKPGERKFIGFDIYDVTKSEFVSHPDMELMFAILGLKTAPTLYNGPYNAEQAKLLTIGDSVLEPSQKVREGVVIRPLTEEKCHIGRKVLKFISDEYLLRDDNTDFH